MYTRTSVIEEFEHTELLASQVVAHELGDDGAHLGEIRLVVFIVVLQLADTPQDLMQIVWR